MSALLTTTMPYMKVVIETMKERGIRDDYVVLVGGAPLNEAFAEAVDADPYCRAAAAAVETATEFMKRRHNQKRAAEGAGERQEHGSHGRAEETTSELQSPMLTTSPVFCLKKNKQNNTC